MKNIRAHILVEMKDNILLRGCTAKSMFQMSGLINNLIGVNFLISSAVKINLKNRIAHGQQ